MLCCLYFMIDLDIGVFYLIMHGVPNNAWCCLRSGDIFMLLSQYLPLKRASSPFPIMYLPQDVVDILQAVILTYPHSFHPL